MIVSVLIVDDSAFFRKRIAAILNADPHIEVIGTAANGREAIDQVVRLKPDVVTMDIEMPVMDGIAAVRCNMRDCPTPVMMFSSLTTAGAQATLDALDAGAVDFLPKKIEEISSDREFGKRQLCARVRIVGIRGRTSRSADGVAQQRGKPSLLSGRNTPVRGLAARTLNKCDLSRYRMVLIGTSTGGPAALQQVLSKLPQNFPLPIVLVQHMPASFTPPFAQRLNSLCRITVRHAENGDLLQPATALLAPGGAQLTIEPRAGGHAVRVVPATEAQTYKPCVDITFASAAEVVTGQVLAIVMTGVGADGCQGARLLKKKGATVWAQDEASCVVAGMPSAIIDAGLTDSILSLDDIGVALSQGA